MEQKIHLLVTQGNSPKIHLLVTLYIVASSFSISKSIGGILKQVCPSLLHGRLEEGRGSLKTAFQHLVDCIF